MHFVEAENKDLKQDNEKLKQEWNNRESVGSNLHKRVEELHEHNNNLLSLVEKRERELETLRGNHL